MDSKAWLSLCVLHAVASMLVWWAGDAWAWELTWRADTWLSRPWTLWTTAWVHINTPHLIKIIVTPYALPGGMGLIV